MHIVDVLLNNSRNTLAYPTTATDANGFVESLFNETSQTWETTTTYYLHSTVLGRQVLTELGEDGAKARTFVYGGGAVLATQKFYGTNQAVEWEHRDPSNATFRVTAVGGSLLQFAELDPTNADAGTRAPLISPEPRDDSGTSLLPYGSFMSARTGLGTSYRVDGIIVSADYFMMQLDSLFHGSSLQMAEYTGRASAPRLRNYEVARYNGRLKVDFGLNKDRAISEALETNSTLIRNWVVNDNWAFASTLFPQDTDRRLTTDEASALRNGIAGLLSDPNCQAFINELLSKVAEQKNDLPFSMDPLKLFDAINGKGGYNYSSQYGYNTALSTLKYSNAAVLLVPRSAFGPAT